MRSARSLQKTENIEKVNPNAKEEIKFCRIIRCLKNLENMSLQRIAGFNERIFQSEKTAEYADC